MPIFLPGYPICVTSKIQVNFWFKSFSEVLMIVSYRFSQYLQYNILKIYILYVLYVTYIICFQGQGIIC